MQDCIFCKIVAGESPCYKVYEDDQYMGILDIFPVRRGHALLITKEHYRWVHDVPNFGSYWEAALKLSKAIQKSLKPKWMQYFTHGLVPHAHIHITPRYEDIETSAAIPHKDPELKLSEKDFREIVRKIDKAL